MDSRLHEAYVQAVLAERHPAVHVTAGDELPRSLRDHAAERLLRLAERLADGPLRQPAPPRMTGVGG
jgi:hypothetical protein